jgi:hypothetical protein
MWYLVHVSERLRAATKQPLLYSAHPRAVQNYVHFRQYLLNRLNGKREFTIDDFGPPDPKLLYSYWSYVPLLLSGWCGHSRRIYQIQPELQKVLEHTSLRDMTWEDIHLPFDAFAIELSFPLMNASGQECDMIVVNAGADRGQWTFAGLRKDLRGYKSVDRVHLEKLVKKGRNALASQEVTRLLREIELREGTLFTLAFGKDRNEPILECLDRITREEWERNKVSTPEVLMERQVQILRIALGLPLYLSSLPVRENHLVATTQAPGGQVSFTSGRPDPNAISNLAEIFAVTSKFKLGRKERLYMGLEGTEEEQAAVRASVGREMSCHFHPGYWRRRPYHGKDPHAPKVVEVSPYIARRDRLPEGALPGGAAVAVE